MANASQYILETHQLTKSYKGEEVVRNLNLRLKEGEIYGFLGPNGAGKTTTIRMLLGLIRATSGEIRMFGKDMRAHRLDNLRQVGSMVESPSYYAHLSGEDNLETIRRIIQVPKQRIQEVLELVRLTKVADRKVKEYSLGMKQRLGIASALLGNPRLLILDEPTNGLDPAGIIEIRELIQKLPGSYGITVLLSSHLLAEIEQFCTHIGIIARGELLYQDEIGALRSQANSRLEFVTNDPPRTAQLLKEMGVDNTAAVQGVYTETIENAQVGQLVKRLVEHNIDLYRIKEHTSSLEDIYLDITRGGESL